MRFSSAVTNDMRYQAKYGFYFLYTFISALYIAVLFFLPGEHKGVIASVIILSDPAMLGIFFIGGIWLLEKREGLHAYLGISPLRPVEYIFSKTISLSVISTLSAIIIVLIGFRETCNYFLLFISIFFGSMVFTLLGLIVATYAHSVNQYMLIATLPSTILITPAILTAIGISHPVFDLFPGTALWYIIADALHMAGPQTYHMIIRQAPWTWIILASWFIIILFIAIKRVPIAILMERGEKI